MYIGEIETYLSEFTFIWNSYVYSHWLIVSQ